MAEFTSKLLCWIFSFTALLPFRLQFDEAGHRLHSFTFSFLATETWWYLSVLVLRLSHAVKMSTTWLPVMLNLMTASEHYSSVHVFVGVVAYITPTATAYLLQFLMLLKIGHVNSALKLIKKFDDQLPQLNHGNSHLKSWCLCASLATIVLTFAYIFPTLNYKPQRSEYQMMMNYVVLELIYSFFHWIQLIAWLVLMYGSFYLTAFRIKELGLILENNQELDNNDSASNNKEAGVNNDKFLLAPSNQMNNGLQKASKLMEKLRKTQELFNQLCQVAKELDSLYSIQALIILFNGFITLTFQFFFLIYNVSNEPILGEDFSYFHTIELLQQIVTIFIMLRAANSPVTEVNNLRELVMHLSTQAKDPHEKLEMIQFMMALKEDRVRLSATGLFNVGMDLIPNMIGSVATYLIILLQTAAGILDEPSHSRHNTSCELTST